MHDRVSLVEKPGKFLADSVAPMFDCDVPPIQFSLAPRRPGLIFYCAL